MYRKFCIKFPQSRMKGERHRLSETEDVISARYCICCAVLSSSISP